MIGWRAATFWRARPPSGLLLRLLAAAAAAAAALTAVAAAVAATDASASAAGSPLLLTRWCRLPGAPLACGSAPRLRPPGDSPGPRLLGGSPAPPRLSLAPTPRPRVTPGPRPRPGTSRGLQAGAAPPTSARGFPCSRGAGQGLARAGGAPWGQPRPWVARHTLDTLTH